LQKDWWCKCWHASRENKNKTKNKK
jgi:hypothetical protein